MSHLPGDPNALVQTTMDEKKLVEQLTAAIRREATVVVDLREALVRQRCSLHSSDQMEVNRCNGDVQRILATLRAAVALRQSMMERLGLESLAFSMQRGDPDRSIEAPLLEAREALGRAAVDVAREVGINRTILCRAVEAGGAFLQALFSSASQPGSSYGDGAHQPERAGPTGLLMNREV